jgi:hypothetical protein
MFNDFAIAILDDQGAIGPFMDAKHALDARDAQQAVDFFADAMGASPLGFKDLNLRVGTYPAVVVTWQPIGDSAAVASISSGDQPADLVLILSRRDRRDEAMHAAAFKSATKDMYEPEVVDVMLGDIAATRGPVAIVARPAGPLQTKAELSLDRAAAALASAFLSRQI